MLALFNYPHNVSTQCTASQAAIVHDFEHVGLNNDYLVNSGDPLALRYNDKV